MIAVLILGAGASSRMQGRDKLLEDVDGMPLLRRQSLRALETGCPVLVALPPPPHPRYAAVAGLGVTLVPVPDAAEGMNASLRAGLRAVPAQAQAVMVLLADMPDLTTDDINTVLQAVDLKSDIRIWRAVTQSGAAGHPTVFHNDLLPALIALRGDIGGRDVAQAYCHRTRLIPLPGAHARTDLDTPQDWAAWRAARE